MIFISQVLLCSHLIGYNLHAQSSTKPINPIEIAKTYIQENLDNWGLAPEDIAEITISDMYTDKSSGITRIYFLQHYKGIPVYNAILNVNMTRDGNVFFSGNRFIQNLKEKINTTIPEISAQDAIMNLVAHLGLPHAELQLKRQSADSLFAFENGLIATEEITASLSYQSYQNKERLAWDILLSPAGSTDKWSTRVDAVNGEVLNEYNWTIYCNVEKLSFSGEEDHCPHQTDNKSNTNEVLEGAQYNVWAAPIESPAHGPRTIVTDPDDPVASPYGWHDINGQPGAEFTITKGNNVHAYQDRDDLGIPSGDEPDGGSELHFDFPFDPAWEPEQYLEASSVNLFYWINYLHDYYYHFGFDEAAGNFQKNNYGRGGVGNDFLWGVSQAGANEGFMNNATYRHNNDGKSSSIHMLVFNRRNRYLTINAPDFITGKYLTSLPLPGWGPGAYVSDIPMTGEVVVVDDGIENPYTGDACEDILNTEELAGKFALIDRGGCQFGFKALKAQNAGAAGVIFANIDDDDFSMAPGIEGTMVNIPVIMVSSTDAQTIREFIGNGLNITLVNSGEESPLFLDSDFDNGIITHEFGHGISSRLTGGPHQQCLHNAEQMGEGWSDFFALANTVRPGDTGDKKRGFSTYVHREPSTGKGFRRYPYSTDMNVMPLTLGDVAIEQEEHSLGEVWGSMLWDMYWALVDRYGWNEDAFDPSSGNYKAIKLVIEGLKNGPCSPGFVDARNAILAADEALYNGENACLLWEVFARRGLGYSADQGSPLDAGDQKEAFDVKPICSKKILIEKSVTDFITPGDDISVTLKVGNFKADSVANVIVTDEIPAGTFFKVNSSNFPSHLQGSTVSFNLGDMGFAQELIIAYTLQSSPDSWSERKFLDDVSGENNDNWLTYTIYGNNKWLITDSFPAHSGNYCWYSKEIPDKGRNAIELNPDVFAFHVDGDNPVMRFYHHYNTKSALNGGIIEVREVGTGTWMQVSDEMIRNGYTGLIDYHTFSYPGLKAFSGDSGNEYQATYVDLRKWVGKNIQIRFRFGTWINTNGGEGWLIDDIEFMDMLSYNGEACLTSDQGDYECAIASSGGTIVESREKTVNTPFLQIDDLETIIFPNPATDIVTIRILSEQKLDVNIRLATLDGKMVFEKTTTIFGNESFHINTNEMVPGIYLVKINTEQGQSVEKLIIQR